MDIPVEINGRLLRALGNFHFKYGGQPIKICIAKRLLTGDYKMETILSVIKHELCHYHLFRNNKEFRDFTPTFDKEALKIGASLSNQIKTSGYIKVGYCSKCNKLVINNAKPKHLRHNYISACCKTEIYFKTEYKEDKTQVILNNLDKEFINKIHKKESPNTIKKTIKNINITDIVKPGKRGVTRAQVHPAVEQAVDEHSIEKLILIKQTYPEYFKQVCIYINKKRLAYLKEIGLAE